MYYDIRNVGYEYLQAERCLKDRDYKQAIVHYQAAIDNYENADNEYLLAPDEEYIIEEDDVQTTFPSLWFMREDAENKIRKLKSFRWKL